MDVSPFEFDYPHYSDEILQPDYRQVKIL